MGEHGDCPYDLGTNGKGNELIPAFPFRGGQVDTEPMNRYPKREGTHPSDASGDLHNRDGTPSPTDPNEASNQPATKSLVLGITSFALIPASVLVVWARLGDVQLDTWTVIVYLISLVAAICASVAGVLGRGLAKEGAPGRVPATIGLVLGIGFIVVSVVGFIVGSIVVSIILSHDSL